MKRTALTLATLAAFLVVLDLLTGAICRGSSLPDRVVDIQHSTTLLAKLDRLRAAPHPKVVLVGDSLIHGGILEEFGDPNWRANGLGPQLQDELGGSAFVMNLGINGALPVDLESLIPLVVACDVDWIMFDVHLRPFSADFSDPSRQMSRPWLREMTTDGAGRAHWRPAESGASRWLSGRMADVSSTVRNRMLVQETLTSVPAAKSPVLRPPARVTETDAEIQALMKLAQLKARLDNLDLAPTSPQPAALQRILRNLSIGGQKHVVFYAKENPDLLPDVLAPDVHAAQSERLFHLAQGALGPSGTFMPPVPELEGKHFVDFTHLNAEGYRVLARALAERIQPR